MMKAEYEAKEAAGARRRANAAAPAGRGASAYPLIPSSRVPLATFEPRAACA